MRANCGTIQGSWSPITFTTGCGAITSLSENFDALNTRTAFPSCWTRLVSGAGTAQISSSSPASGTRHVYQYSSSAANKSVIVLLEFSNINAGTHRLRFKARGSTALAIMEVGYVTSLTDINSFVLVESININNTSYTATNAERSVYFPTNFPTNSRIAIRNNGTNTASIYWDDINWELAPACASPSATYTTAVTQNSATLNWTAPLTVPGAGYQYYYSTTNSAPTSATTASGPATTNSIALNSLTPNTKYYYWVRSVCATNNYSAWGTTDSFFTGHCIPQGLTTNTSSYLSNIFTSGATQNISYTAAVPIGYVDSSTQILQTFPTNVIQYNIGNNTNVANNYYIWVDWNNDLDFNAAGETILATTNWPTLATGSLTIPANVILGNYRLCVANSNSGTVTRCGPSSHGNYVDFTLQVNAMPSCVAPTGFSTNNITASGATLHWTASTSTVGIGYDYFVTTNNLTIPTATTTLSGTNAANTTSTVINTLFPATTYYYWMRSKCSNTSASTWYYGGTFTTLCSINTLPYTEDFNTAPVPSVCWASMTGAQSANSNLTSTTTGWVADQWLNTIGSTTDAMRVNLNLGSSNQWLITPQINLGSTPGAKLQFDIAALSWGTSTAVPLDNDDSIAVVISTDGGLTWSSSNTLAVFTAADGIIGGTQGFATKFITLTDTGIVKIGFYATNGNTANTQNTDVMIDNIGILAQCSSPLFASIIDTFLCENGSVTISLGASGTNNYHWSNGGTTNTNTFLSAGTFNVIATDGTCATVDTFNIDQLTAPIVNGINTQGTVPTFQFEVDGTTDAHTTYTWDFGDGTTSIDANPSHTFPTTSTETTYDVRVIVSHPCGTDTASTTITVQGNSIRTSKTVANNILVYPNPSKEFINIDASQSAKIEKVAVFNLMGQEVQATKVNPSHKVTIGLGNLANGSYLLRIETEAGTAFKQISTNK